MAQAKSPKPIHHNHRARMRQRVLQNGFDSLQEHEALEYLLFYCIPRKDTNALAHQLIDRFHGYCGVLEASEEELMQVEGIGPGSASMIHSLLDFLRYYEVHKRMEGKPLKTLAEQTEYVRPLFLGFQEELMYLIALDSQKRPLRNILVAKGLPDKVSFDPQALARIAVTTKCSCALLAHNHPGGPAFPSSADCQATELIVGALGPVGIDVVDHLIVTPSDTASLLESGHLPHYDPYEQKVSSK